MPCRQKMLFILRVNEDHCIIVTRIPNTTAHHYAMAYNSEAWRSRYQTTMSEARAHDPSSGAYTYQMGGDPYYEDLSHSSPYYMPPSTDRSVAWSTSSQADTPRADTIGSPSGASVYMDYQQNEFYQAQNIDSLMCHCGKTFRRASDLT